MDDLILTKHARERWYDRFSYLDMEEEIKQLRRVKKSEKEAIRTQCYRKKYFKDKCFYLMTDSNVVFVCCDKRDYTLVVTIMPFSGGTQKSLQKIKGRKQRLK